MNIHGMEYEIELRVAASFHASHALPARPEQHEHRWEVEFTVAGGLNPETGMVCDMLILAEFFKPFTEELNGMDLHQYPDFKGENRLIALAADYPTCDTLAHYFLWKTIPVFNAQEEFRGLRISQVKVSIFEPGGTEAWGHALIRPKSL